jgi:hypothetical protein
LTLRVEKKANCVCLLPLAANDVSQEKFLGSAPRTSSTADNSTIRDTAASIVHLIQNDRAQVPDSSVRSVAANERSDPPIAAINSLLSEDFSTTPLQSGSSTTDSSLDLETGSFTTTGDSYMLPPTVSQPAVVLPSLDEIPIQPHEYPQKFRDEHFDVVLIYTVDDCELAEGFRYVLQTCITLEVRSLFYLSLLP